MVMAETTQYLKSKLPQTPHVAVVLGSGLSDMGEELSQTISIPFTDIPDFPQPTVSGHQGEFIFGYLKNIPVLFAKGRIHFYEGLAMKTITLPVRLYADLGIPNFILTNSAGCLNPKWNIGDIMMINGHLDCTYRSGLIRPQLCKGLPWYKDVNIELAQTAARTCGIRLRQGAYAWMLGPTYETPAEIKSIQELGGSAVGMSTLPEIVSAGELGLNFMGFSCLSNFGAGMKQVQLAHEDVLTTALKFQGDFKKLIREIIINI